MTEEAQSEYKEEARRMWWKERHHIDTDLQSLLEYAERAYFSKGKVKQLLVPDSLFDRDSIGSSSDDDSSECSYLGPGNLESKFEAVEYEPEGQQSNQPKFDKETERSNLTKCTVAVIKTKLGSFGVSEKDARKLRKAELIDLLLSEMESNHISGTLESSSPHEKSCKHDVLATDAKSPSKCPIDADEILEEPCTILILDEYLHRFPFESMGMFQNIAVTRVPSLPFVLATLSETKALHSNATPMADPRKVKYVLDPESNLSESASTLAPALESIASRNGWEWEGVVGQMPSAEFMSSALSEENGLYLYCGHGGGEKAFSRSEIEELIGEREDGIRGCRAPIVLMGCSSGKLHSVNTPKENPFDFTHTMHYEPEGIALTYLYAGAPCVVGNLWDVTDRDIDR